MKEEHNKKIIFAAARYNQAETGRLIEIARVCKNLFNLKHISKI